MVPFRYSANNNHKMYGTTNHAAPRLILRNDINIHTDIPIKATSTNNAENGNCKPKNK